MNGPVIAAASFAIAPVVPFMVAAMVFFLIDVMLLKPHKGFCGLELVPHENYNDGDSRWAMPARVAQGSHVS